MDNCLAAAALNGVDRRSLQRSARLALEVLERAKRRAVDWHALERPKGCMGVLAREAPHLERQPAAGPQRVFPGEKYYSSVPEEGGATHVYRYHRGKSKLYMCSDIGNGQAENISKDLYIEVYPGTYSVTVGSNDLTKKTHVVAVDSGQSVDLVFPM
ncbi:PREDICTED: A-kinase-interacting protein 1 isoform X4 [Cercocebus atys]|uniref:A-kinase-interacting protein 1 isoform X4 n=1 Tax=Cercocebus atys TaxID=9531 RepID=UPI0005F449D1|nr:PREDICTED: A-kinase-interacting protein 1 isoform X4 [Cercocebus atys]XP_025212342.1 A-kinase-interacting protein 1 isoform X4 [Theropithecus gelada]